MNAFFSFLVSKTSDQERNGLNLFQTLSLVRWGYTYIGVFWCFMTSALSYFCLLSYYLLFFSYFQGVRCHTSVIYDVIFVAIFILLTSPSLSNFSSAHDPE